MRSRAASRRSHGRGWTTCAGAGSSPAATATTSGTTCGCSSAARDDGRMSNVYVHSFAISLDGFGTGEGLSREEPFGHAGERLHEWMFATRGFTPGGGGRVDYVFAQRHDPGIGAEIMGSGKYG